MKMKRSWLKASAIIALTVGFEGLPVLQSQVVHATVQTVKARNPKSTVVHHYGTDKANRELTYDEPIAWPDDSSASFLMEAAANSAPSAASAASGVATGHVASYLGIIDSLDYNAVATANSALASPYNNIVDLRTPTSTGGIVYGTGELIAPGIVLTAGHVAVDSSAALPTVAYTVDSIGEAGKADSFSTGYSVASVAVDPVFASNSAVSSSYNPLDDLGIEFLSTAPSNSSYFSISTVQASGQAMNIAGYPCDNFQAFDLAEQWKTTGNTMTDSFGNVDGLYWNNVTPNAGICTNGQWYIGGTIMFGGASGSPIFNNSNQLIGVFDGTYTSNLNEQFGTQMNPTTVKWISDTISGYNSSHGISTPGFSVSGVWGSASWTMSPAGVLTIGTGSQGAATLAAGDPLIELQSSIKSVIQPTAQGTWGTASWSLASNGALTINAGTMGENTAAANDPMITQQNAITSINITGTLNANSTSSLHNLFSNLPQTAIISGISNIVLPTATSGYDASYMFQNDVKLTNLPMSGFNTANVTNMASMFENTSVLKTLNLSGLNTSNVTNMSYMFYKDSSLTGLDLSSFNTSKVQYFNSMFDTDSSMTSLNISSFNTSQAINMGAMFSVDSSLTNLSLSNFTTLSVTNMAYMFYHDSSLSNLDVSHFDTSNTTNMSNMFDSLSSLTGISLLNFNTSHVTNMSYMFINDDHLQVLDLTNFTITPAATVVSMLSGSSSLSQITIGNSVTMSTSMGLANPPTSKASWQNIGTGTPTAPNGTIVGNSTALESGVPAGTYVWQP